MGEGASAVPLLGTVEWCPSAGICSIGAQARSSLAAAAPSDARDKSGASARSQQVGALRAAGRERHHCQCYAR